MNAAIFRMILNWMASKPCAMMAAPAKPPISVCEEEEGFLPPSEQIPGNSRNHAGQNDRQSNVRLHHRFRYGVGNAETADDTLGDEKATKLKKAAHITA